MKTKTTANEQGSSAQPINSQDRRTISVLKRGKGLTEAKQCLPAEYLTASSAQTKQGGPEISEARKIPNLKQVQTEISLLDLQSPCGKICLAKCTYAPP